MNDRELFEEAMDHVQPRQIAEAARPRKRRVLRWAGSLAAILAIVIAATTLLPVLTLRAGAVSEAVYPEYEWKHRTNINNPLRPLHIFWQESMGSILSGQEGNAVFSPVNLSMGLSIAAELTAGSSRQQILDALNITDPDTLSDLFHEIWLATYYDDGDQVLLANSLWLDRDLDYNQDTMDMLAEEYYTSVYSKHLAKASGDIQNWINQQTKGFLKQETANIAPPERAFMMLYSTIYYRAKWSYEFRASDNTTGTFHGLNGDSRVTYMNKDRESMRYYWGEDFSAVALHLKDGSSMYLILPDAGKTVDDILARDEYYQMLTSELTDYAADHSKYMLVNLSIPQFDIRQQSNLKEDLQQMGITDVFDPGRGDFSNILVCDEPLFLTAVNQATRVAIDEQGVTAASYIEFPGAGAGMPPEEIIDFILDRPFLFVVKNRYNIPLFAGVVNDIA